MQVRSTPNRDITLNLKTSVNLDRSSKDNEKNFQSVVEPGVISRPKGYKTFFILNQLSMESILLINVKMPTIVGILTFISRINTVFESFKVRTTFIFQHFDCYEQFISFSYLDLYVLGDD